MSTYEDKYGRTQVTIPPVEKHGVITMSRVTNLLLMTLYATDSHGASCRLLECDGGEAQ